MSRTVLAVYGTRPEAIKMAPVIRALRASDMECVVAVTGQHREMLDQVNELFEIVPDQDLNVFEPGQNLNTLTAKVFSRLDPVLEEVKPDAVLVQGDTTTVAAAAIASLYRQVPVVHLEAGLRSGDLWSPFPEEANRKLVSQISSLHLAPTAVSRDNLLREGVFVDDIVVTGNTVIDALLTTVERDTEVTDPALARAVAEGRDILLVTTHRRENWGGAMENVGRALRRLSESFPDLVIVLPAHRNPIVREAVLPQLEGRENVIVTEPLDYAEFIKVMSAGTVRLIGTDENRVFDEVSRLMTVPTAYQAMSHAENPYGDGRAAERTVAAIAQLLGVGERIADFTPDAPRNAKPEVDPAASPSLATEH